MTEIFRRGTLVVWFYEAGDDKSTGPSSKSTFYGQDLGGYPGASEYEYWFTVDPNDLRRALAIAPEDDLEAAVLTHANDIVTSGETRWLAARDVPYDFHNRIEWDRS
jgi:hypothetical protein